jgi:hypothetical protein
MQQASGQQLQTQVARHLISASLDLLKQRYAKRGEPPVRIEAVSDEEWKVGDFRLVYIPVVNDDVVNRWENDACCFNVMYLIVSPGYERVLFHSLVALLGRSAPTIISLDSYVSLRALFSTMDFNWSQERCNIEFVKAYNRCALEAQADSLVLISGPEVPNATKATDST